MKQDESGFVTGLLKNHEGKKVLETVMKSVFPAGIPERRVAFLFFLFLLHTAGLSMDLKKEIDLETRWRFEIGDNTAYSRPEFDDSKWELVEVPDPWEEQGFPGYDGYAWYRIQVRIPADLSQCVLYLRLGKVDGVDITYLNGKEIGRSGIFPPEYESASSTRRIYAIPADMIRFDALNTIAVRVYDAGDKGGIVDGDVGIYSREDVVQFEIDLSGSWKFRTGDDPSWAKPSCDDGAWSSIRVPGRWENQGYPDYDGIAWYRRSVIISALASRNKLILLLGKINDIDEVFFNGKKIGGMGRFPGKDRKAKTEDYYKKERAYFIPPELIQKDRSNVIAVRVLDTGKNGGIYEDPVCIVTREEYLRYMKRKD